MRIDMHAWVAISRVHILVRTLVVKVGALHPLVDDGLSYVSLLRLRENSNYFVSRGRIDLVQ